MVWSVGERIRPLILPLCFYNSDALKRLLQAVSIAPYSIAYLSAALALVVTRRVCFKCLWEKEKEGDGSLPWRHLTTTP